MKVYLIRHAQSEENALDLKLSMTVRSYNELLRRSHATPLTPEGERQARELVHRLAAARIERLYSSPYVRALRTATVLGEALGMTPTIRENLREVLPRQLNERRPNASLRRLFVQSYLSMLLPWGPDETMAAGYRRAKAAWLELTADPAAEIAAVAHRGLIGLMLLAIQRDGRWRIVTRDLSNGGISLVARRPA